MRNSVPERARREALAYDKIAIDLMESADIAELTSSLIGENLVFRYLKGLDLGQFPKPFSLWSNSIQEPISQISSYDWLCPVAGRRFLQIGGAGSHAIKALMAGADSAVLLTPSFQEGRIACKMAEFLGIDDRLDVVLGFGEQMPFDQGSIDRVYGGSTLHHIDIRQGISEVARVLTRRGRASFCEPRLTFLYRLFENTRIRRMVRETGAECYPMKISDIMRHSSDHFGISQCLLSGGFTRYGIALLTRGFKIPVPFVLSLCLQATETRILKMLGMSSVLGSLAVLLEK